MKRYQKILALLLVLLMTFALSGCSVITITKTAANMSDLDSVTADLNLDLNVDMTMMEETSPFKINVAGPLDLDLEGDKGKAEFTIDLMGENVPLLLYYEKLEDKLVFYTSADNGETWSKNETSLSGEKEKGSSDLKSLAMIKKLAGSFEETGTETVRGTEAVIYSGSILWKDLLGDVDLSSAMEAAGEAAGSAAGTPLDLSGMDLTALGSIPVTIGFDKENALIVKGSIDLTETVQNLIPMVMKVAMQSMAAQSGVDAAEMEDFDLSALGFNLDIHTLTVSAELYNFDAVGEIMIPPEALAAEVAEAA
ncbi:MAG: hypothetical protein IJV30_00980 [Oscillospiraceae bacterium]|nr:hypothetical protein [Oscillospiraceae bacterium]